MIKLAVFKKICQYYNVASLKAGNAVSKHKWEYKLQNVPAVPRPIS